jgi:D-xylose transport system ATP-binding protein
MLSARGLTMDFPGVRALGGVDFELRAGEIHALCGENGAGKSTLIKILGGVIPHGRYGGTVEFEGETCRFEGPGDALKAGIRIIHQELALCGDLSVAENICLGEEPARFGIVDHRRMEREAAEQLEKLGLSRLDPRQRASALPVGIRQMVEIARALRHPTTGPSAGRGKVLILDEPTSALSAPEEERLEAVLRRLRDEGYGLLYISHRLDEVFRLADRVTVLRNGGSMGTVARAEFDANRVITLMVGRKAGDVFPPRTLPPSPLGERGGAPRLSVRGWTVPSPDNPDKNALENVSLELRAGEILGLAGLMGSGRTELCESLCGLFPARGRGEIRVDGAAYVPDGNGIARGLALLSEDRRGHGILPGKSVRENMTCASLRDFSRGGWIRQGEEIRAVREKIAGLDVKTPGPDFPIDDLSGGNQQKALLARCLLTRPKILILDEPTRGIDVGAKAEIYRLIQNLASEGMGIVLVSSEIEEVLRLSHRVLILRGGRVAAERAGGALELEEAMAIAAGAA